MSLKGFHHFFRIDTNSSNKKEVATIPLNGEKSIRFSTDVANDYFDRIEEPGDLRVSVLNIKPNDSDGGNKPGEPKEIDEVFNVVKSSPNKGKIKISLNPKDELKIGDSIQMKASLSSPNGNIEELFWVKIADNNKPKSEAPKKESDNDLLGLPKLVFMYKSTR